MYILLEYIKVDPADVPAIMGFQLVVNAVVAVSLMIPMLWRSVDGMVAFSVVNGAGFGMFMAVDLALMTKVLPHTGDAGKDMGLLNIAGATGRRPVRRRGGRGLRQIRPVSTVYSSVRSGPAGGRAAGHGRDPMAARLMLRRPTVRPHGSRAAW
ncbi:hypothetical protein ACFT9I_34550 [Streptomyces sp. NPDC057137]|uniref:hypothetical protein n=1 Tax=Streptomyces sp. NPDC057137 TaxID=3346030 RepID=UPI00364359D8